MSNSEQAVVTQFMTIKPSQETELAPKPATVSSTSSIDTSSTVHETGKENGDTTSRSLGMNKGVSMQGSTTVQSFGAETFGYQHMLYAAPGTSSTTPMDQVPSSVSLVARPTQLHISPSTGVILPSMPATNTVPEFLYQLTKMLTDNNREVIEWSNGKIEVHSPHKLELTVLNRYFRHSKFASFQRQLNYFGFRKLAGKGKMAPCSYINDATTRELGSLLLIKRKAGNEPKAKVTKKRLDEPKMMVESHGNDSDTAPVNLVLASILYSSSDQQFPTTHPREQNQTNTSSIPIQPQTQQQALAQVAVGRGIRHGYTVQKATGDSNARQVVAIAPAPIATKSPVEASLSALQNNYHNSLQNLSRLDAEENAQGHLQYLRSSSMSLSNTTPFIPGSLSRDDSLVDLAMIPQFDETEPIPGLPEGSNALTFVDFPWMESNAIDDYGR